MEVVGEATNGRAAVEMAKEKEPDVVLMDIGMPELNGFEATRQIKRHVPATKVLVLSGHDNDQFVREIVRSGANGYVLKNTPPEEIKKAVIAVSKGLTFFSPSLSEAATRDHADEPKDVLTTREREILQLIAEGKSHSQIAERLYISVRTVDTHRNNILKKLRLHDAAGLVTYAIKNGIVILPK